MAQIRDITNDEMVAGIILQAALSSIILNVQIPKTLVNVVDRALGGTANKMLKKL